MTAKELTDFLSKSIIKQKDVEIKKLQQSVDNLKKCNSNLRNNPLHDTRIRVLLLKEKDEEIKKLQKSIDILKTDINRIKMSMLSTIFPDGLGNDPIDDDPICYQTTVCGQDPIDGEKLCGITNTKSIFN